MGIDFTAALCILTVSGQEALERREGIGSRAAAEAGRAPPLPSTATATATAKALFVGTRARKKMTGREEKRRKERTKGGGPEKKHELDWKLD